MNSHGVPFWTAIDGFFDYADLYDMLVERLAPGDLIVEVGSYLGKSACYLGQKIRESGKVIHVICVDCWPSVYTRDDGVRILDPYHSFLANVEQAHLGDILYALRASSQVAATLIRNELGAVFIDASHDYLSVMLDIESWLPKVRSGGFLVGHDYGDTFPGVKQAVDELLPEHESFSFQCWLKSV